MFDKSSLSEQVEHALRKEITEGRLVPGTRVNVSEMQAAWNVSSTPFRDAIRALEVQGFVTIEPRKGVYVAQMNRETLKEIFELRIALECMAIELATPLVPIDIARRVATLYQQQARGENSDALNVNDAAVHDIGRDHCGNARLQRLLVSQSDAIRWAQNTIIIKVPHPFEAALPEHVAIMEAVCERDAQQAGRCMRLHLENSYARITAQLSSTQNV